MITVEQNIVNKFNLLNVLIVNIIINTYEYYDS